MCDGVPFDPGRPHESYLRQRLAELLQLEEQCPGEYGDELDAVRDALRREEEFNNAVDYWMW